MESAHDAGYWKRIDALLGEALALPPEARAAWLDELRKRDEKLAPVLERILARAGGATDFMDQPLRLQDIAGRIAEDKPGDIVGPYRLIRLYGQGGMGAVWCAERADGSLQRTVALKLPPTGWSRGLSRRVERESRILATLEHPNIARLYDAGVAEGGRPYLAMQGIDGVPIDRYCREKSVPLEGRLRLFLQVARAVAYAHAHLVVHRDLKPNNILVDGEGTVHVVDFGIAKLLDVANEGDSSATHTMVPAFTPQYASPEQVHGGELTVASDVYSLGLVLYELLCRERPYRLDGAGRSPAAIEKAILESDPPPPSARVQDRALARALRGDLDTIVARALRKDPEARYPTMAAFANDVERHLRGEPVLAQPDSLLYRAGKFVNRHRAGVAFATMLLAVGTLGVAGIAYQAHVARGERDKALRELRYAEASEEFLRFLLGEQAGRPVVPQELLKRAHESVNGQFSKDAPLRARLQLVLSDLYGEVNDFPQAERLAREAMDSAAAAQDESALAQARCALGSLLGTTGRRDEADAIFAATMPQVDARRESDPRAFQACHAWRGNYRRNRDQPGAGDDFRATLESMEAGGTPLTTARVRLKASIADSYASAGRLAEALALYDEASAELARMGRANTSAGWTLVNNHIYTLARAGRLKQAEQVYTRAVGSPADGLPASSDLGSAIGRVLVDLGRLDDAERLLRAAAEDKARIGHKRGEAYALLGLARAICARGDVPACDAAVARSRERFESFERPGHVAFAILEHERGVARRLAGDPRGARPYLEHAVAGLQAASDRNPFLARALASLALCLDALGEDAAARESAARAVATAREITVGVPESEWVGTALLAQSKIEARVGDPAAARAMAEEARRHLAATT